MTSPPSLSSYGLPTSFSAYSSSQPFQRSNPNHRGRGQNHQRGGRGGRGNYRGGGPSHRGGFKYDGRHNNHKGGGGQQGDMKTGLFRDSFLEDPWKDLVPRKTGVQLGVGIPPPSFYSISQTGGNEPIKTQRDSNESVRDMEIGDGDGEIVLPDSDEEETSEIGLGDGLVEAARKA